MTKGQEPCTSRLLKKAVFLVFYAWVRFGLFTLEVMLRLRNRFDRLISWTFSCFDRLWATHADTYPVVGHIRLMRTRL